MKIAYVNPSTCDKSPACPARRICPVEAITQKGNGAFAFLGGGTAIVDPEQCTGCAKCLNYCPGNAISMIEKSES